MDTLAFARYSALVTILALAALGGPSPAARADQAAPSNPAPRCRALAALKNPDPQVRVEIMLVPVVLKRGDGDAAASIDHEIALGHPIGVPRLAADTEDFIFKAKVTGTVKSAHVAVLELQTATDRPSVLWPAADAPPLTDILPADGAWHTLLWHTPENTDLPAIFAATKPYGKEIYKAFATTEAIDFPSLLSADNSRAPLTPIGLLVKHAMSGAATPGSPLKSTPDAIIVQVVPGT